MKVLAIILLTVLLIGFLLLVDYQLGRKKHLSALKKHEFPFRESHFEIFTHGSILFEDFFSELRKAKNNIHTIFYICKNDPISQEFLDILKEKAVEGLEVRLLLDWVGSIGLKRKKIKELKEAGVKFAFSRVPRFPFLFYSSQVRNHRKITVIDGVVGYVGGFNVGMEYIDLDPKLSPWRDYHLKITGEGVEDLQRQFLLDWLDASKTNLLQSPIYFPKLTKGTIRHQFFATEGGIMETTFSGLIQRAKIAIMIGSPYFIPSKKILNDLCKAIDRGVSLTVLVPSMSDHILVQEASYPFLRKLLKKGAQIYSYKIGFYHAKVLLIDDHICDLGTANFDKRSFFLNQEINCFIHDPAYIERIKKILDKDLLDSKKISLSDLLNLGLFSSFKEMVAKMASFFL